MHITKNLLSAIFCVFICSCITGKSTGKHKKHSRKKPPSNFAFVNYNQFQQRELRIAYEGILSLETSIFQNTNYQMTLRQITDGRRIVQLIHQEGILKDCETSEKGKAILKFVSEFMLPDDYMTSDDHGNVFKVYNMTNRENNQNIDALQHFRKRHFLGPFLDVINIRHAKKMCNRLNRQKRRLAHRKKPADDKEHNANENTIMVPNGLFRKTDSSSDRRQYLETGMSSAQEHGLSSEDIHGIIKDGLRHLYTPPALDSGESKETGLIPNGDLIRPDTESTKTKLSRRKRSFLTSFLIYPGTKWCGRGDIAMSREDLGTDAEADICCRDHDLCNEVILPFTTRYNTFNYRIHSLVSCNCDARFRACLMQSVSPIANFLGKIYFNVLGTKCFKLKKEKVCVIRSWWGTCRTHENQQVAHLRNQRGF